MIFRNFRRLSDGRWLDVLLTSAGTDFSVPALRHREQIATGFQIPLADVEVVDGPTDARTGPLVPAPVREPPPADPDIAAFAAATDTARIRILGRRAGIAP